MEPRFWGPSPSLEYRNLPSAKLHGLILQMTLICLLPIMRTSCLKTDINKNNNKATGSVITITTKIRKPNDLEI